MNLEFIEICNTIQNNLHIAINNKNEYTYLPNKIFENSDFQFGYNFGLKNIFLSYQTVSQKKMLNIFKNIYYCSGYEQGYNNTLNNGINTIYKLPNDIMKQNNNDKVLNDVICGWCIGTFIYAYYLGHINGKIEYIKKNEMQGLQNFVYFIVKSHENYANINDKYFFVETNEKFIQNSINNAIQMTMCDK